MRRSSSARLWVPSSVQHCLHSLRSHHEYNLTHKIHKYRRCLELRPARPPRYSYVRDLHHDRHFKINHLHQKTLVREHVHSDSTFHLSRVRRGLRFRYAGGTGLNPAVTFAGQLVGGMFDGADLTYSWMLFTPLIGGALAGLFFRYVYEPMWVVYKHEARSKIN